MRCRCSPTARAVTPAPFGPGHVGKGAVRREPCALRAPTADRLGWATPGERCIALHSQRGAQCFFSSRCDDGLHGGAHGVLQREAKVGVDVAWETRTMDPLHVVMHVAAMGHLLGLAQGTSLHGIRVHTTLVLRDVPSVFHFAQSSVHYPEADHIAPDLVGQELSHPAFEACGIARFRLQTLFGSLRVNGRFRLWTRAVPFFFEGQSLR